MRAGINIYPEIKPEMAAFIYRDQLTKAQIIDITEKYAGRADLPENMGDTLKMWRIDDLAVVDAPLAEDMNPEGEKLAFTTVQVVVNEYGKKVVWTKKIEKMHQTRISKEVSELLTRNYALTSLQVTLNALVAGTKVFYNSSGSTRVTVNGPITNTILKRVKRSFQRDGAEPMRERMKAGLSTATEGVPESFIVFCHVDHEPDIKKLENFLPVEKYPDQDKREVGEIGSCDGFRFIASRFMKVVRAGASSTSSSSYLTNGDNGSSSAPDVYLMVAIAQDSYRRVALRGNRAVSINIFPPGISTKEDPTGRTGVASWTAYLAAVIEDETRVARIEVACSNL